MKIRIQKYNPMTDAEPYYVEGDIEYREKMTALDAVYDFHKNIEPISYEYSCGGRVCGRCAATIDGQPGLMCMTMLDDAEHVIEPLAGLPIVRDLVVDKSSIDSRLSNVSTRVMTEPVTVATIVPQNFDSEAYASRDRELLLYAERCGRCGLCMSVCSALSVSKDRYIGPALMLQIAYRHMDWYDKADRIAQAVSSGLYECIMCGNCDEVCMQGIPHMDIWKMLREKAEASGMKPSNAS